MHAPFDRGEGNRPVHQYQPRSLQFPKGSYVDISNEHDARIALRDQVERVGPNVSDYSLQSFYKLLASLQTDQYQTFSSLLYWRNTGDDDLREPEVFCSDILITLSGSEENTPVVSAVHSLTQAFQKRLRAVGQPTAVYRKAAIHLRMQFTIFGNRIDPKPSGYSLEVKVLGGGRSKQKAVGQWAKAVELIIRVLQPQ